MSVTNRKMFRRDARNKLRNMGGIMASSEPLIQEVARFQNGGGVLNFINKYINPIDPKTGNLKAMQYLYERTLPDEAKTRAEGTGYFPRASAALTNPKYQAPVDRVETVPQQYMRNIGKFADVIGSGGLDLLLQSSSAANRLGDSQISGEGLKAIFAGEIPMKNVDGTTMTQDQFQAQVANSTQLTADEKRRMFGMTDEFLAQGDDELAKYLPTKEGIQEQIKKAQEEQKEADVSTMREQERKRAIEGGMLDPSQQADLETVQDEMSGGRISSEAPQTLGVTADQGTEYEHKLATDEFRKSGNLDNVKKTVQNTVNSGIGTGGALKQLINEFTSNAPEYEGMDKGLAIAKIGFAMAAGQSPNAITNIANALSQGADMFLKDDEQRRNFKRQVDLAGLQYGLGEISKMRTEARAQARQDRNLKYFVAGEDMTFDGVKYGKDDIVAVSEGYIRERGVPPGLTTENLVKGAQTLKSQIEKMLAEQNEKKIMSDKDYRANREVISDAASKFEESRNLMTLVEGSIYKVVGGEVTGLAPAAKNLIDRAFAAAFNGKGVEQDKTYRSVAEYNRDMQEVANKLIKEIIQEGGKNISNVDRQLAQEIVGLYTGYGGYVFQNENVLLGRLQSIHKTLQKTQAKSIADMTDMLNLSIGRTFQSGDPVTYSRVGETALGAIGQQGGGTKDIFLKDLLTDGQVDADKVTNIFGIS